MTSPRPFALGAAYWNGGTVAQRGLATCYIEVVVRVTGETGLRHTLDLRVAGQRMRIGDELIEKFRDVQDRNYPDYPFRYSGGHVLLGSDPAEVLPIYEDDKSILAQIRDPVRHPELWFLARSYGRIQVLRDGQFGRRSPVRYPQRADDRNDVLSEDHSNLGLVLSRLKSDPGTKLKLLAGIRQLNSRYSDLEIVVEGGTVQIFLTAISYCS